MRKNRLAFTLAELLITIAIVGVVAALTIPNLINNYRAKQLRTQYLKAYSTITQALRAMEGDEISLVSTPPVLFYKNMMKYLNGATDCGTGVSSVVGCYDLKGTTYKYINGTEFTIYNQVDDGQILLSDGTLLMFDDYYGDIKITVDINGIKSGQNKWGYDLFRFKLVDGKLVPMASSGADCVKGRWQGGESCSYRAQSETDYFNWAVKNIK
jgi:prepilin-type N-terminal cleavage/methylation domain-containing protein